MQQAEAVRRLETEAVRVTEWQFAPGAETGHHRHNYDYVVVPLTGGTLRLVEPDGERTATLAAGIAYSRKAGVEHNVINAGDQYLAFVEVELMDRPG
jgi:beta-alanine degradation protein BauB